MEVNSPAVERRDDPPPTARPRFVGRVALVCLVIALVVVAIRSAPALCERYGYREVGRRTVGLSRVLEIRRDLRRASWLPIPEERLRIENVRGEEVARLWSRGAPPIAAHFMVDFLVQDSGAGVELDYQGEKRRFVPDFEGVLVPEGILPEPLESSYSGFDRLRLHPDSD